MSDTTMSPLSLVVGLGNPGPTYSGSRHNVGFEVIAELGRRCHPVRWERRCDSDLGRSQGGPPMWLSRPLTYMNLCGAAVVCLLEHLDLAPSSMLVVVDDVDLPLATLRLRREGGPGTHNGLRDICDRVGTSFPRLRVGVRGEEPWEDLADYVLSPFPKAERETVEAMVLRAADAVEVAFADGLDAAMGRFNRRPEDVTRDHRGPNGERAPR